jgi:hypothetical protein
MTMPMELVDRLWEVWLDDKRELVEWNHGPIDMGLRFALDFGTAYKTWPFFSIERAAQHGLGADKIDVNSDERVLAVMDINNDRPAILQFLAEMMTIFGPPEHAMVFADSFTKHVPVEDVDKMTLVKHGDLEADYHNNPESDVVESLTVTASSAGGFNFFRTTTYKYDDKGQIEFIEEHEDDGQGAGFLTTLIQRCVDLHGKEPYDVLVALADGDKDDIDQMLKDRMN